MSTYTDNSVTGRRVGIHGVNIEDTQISYFKATR